MMKNIIRKIFGIVQIGCLLLFFIFIFTFGFKELILIQDISPQDEIKNSIRFLAGFFLGIGINILSSLFKNKQTNQDNYVEKKINKIFDKNFQQEIKSPNERIRIIEYEFLDYEIDAYIDIAIEISKMNQNLLYQVPLMGFAIIGIIASIISFPLTNQSFSNGLFLGIIFYVFYIIYQPIDKSNKWKMMYYDLMIIKSNRKP